MEHSTGAAYLAETLRALQQYKGLGDRAVAQAGDRIFDVLDEDANSIAVLMKHLAGNMRSRWTDFLTSDGEKPDRNRDAEFQLDPATTPGDVHGWWEAGWRCTFAAIEALGADDLLREVRVRGEPLTVLQAINRQMAHYAYHIGQIVLLAKHARGPGWQPLSTPARRGR